MILTISHHIFLTKEERYAIEKGTPTTVVGVSLPVWMISKQSSEPVEEIFCKYHIENNKDEKGSTILFTKQGYRINLPQIPKNWKCSTPLTNEDWRKMSEKELSIWYKKNSTPKNANNLLDLRDGGSAYLQFKFVDGMKKDNKEIRIVHYCELEKIETLSNSLI